MLFQEPNDFHKIGTLKETKFSFRFVNEEKKNYDSNIIKS